MINLTRRRVLRAGGAAAGGSAISNVLAQTKMSKQAAQYQDSPKDIRMCATCTLFVPPRGCQVVEGDINPDGWCKAYAMAD